VHSALKKGEVARIGFPPEGDLAGAASHLAKWSGGSAKT